MCNCSSYPLGRNLISILLLTSCFNILIMIIFQSTWPQLDISSCSYQSYSIIALILLYLAAPFFTATGCFCLAFLLQEIICFMLKHKWLLKGYAPRPWSQVARSIFFLFVLGWEKIGSRILTIKFLSQFSPVLQWATIGVNFCYKVMIDHTWFMVLLCMIDHLSVTEVNTNRYSP